MRARFLLTASFALLFTPILAGTAWGQAPPPKLTHVSPSGGQAGATFEVTVVGTDLEKTEGLHFSFPGAKVEVVSGPSVVPTDPKKKPPVGMKPGLSQKFKVTLSEKTPLGIHDIRIVTKGGVSNPRAFVVGDQKEFIEQEPNDDVDKAQQVELNSTVSGVIGAPTDVDYYQFSGKKGQRVVLSCLTTSIDSKLPVELKLLGPGDRYLGSNRGYLQNDALLDALLPVDGDYQVRLCSFSYTQGGADYFYRLTITTAPWIDAVFPPTVEPGKEAKLTVYGRNLPGGVLDPTMTVDGRSLEKVTATVKAPADQGAGQRLVYGGLVNPSSSALDGFEFRLSNKAGQSNPFLITFARAPVVLDEENNDTFESAQKVPVPCEVAGRIDKKGDRDWYRFEAKKGQPLSIEAYGDRLGSATDLHIQVQNDMGKTVIELDDNPDVFAPHFFTRSDDPPRFRFVPPTDGEYFLMIGARDAFVQYGPRHLYTVRIVHEAPDFRLVAMPFNSLSPDAAILHQAGHQAMQVFIWRQDGFTGDITFSAQGLPDGVSMPPQVIGGSQKSAALILKAEPNAPLSTTAIKIVGTATVNGKKLVREVRSATITWLVAQANTPTVSRIDRELVLAVRETAPYTLIAEKEKVVVLQGDKIQVSLKLNVLSPDFKATVQIAPLALPTGMVLAPATVAPGDKDTVLLTFDAKATVPPGNYTLVVRGQTQPLGKPVPPKGAPNLMQTAAPIMMTIVPKQLAKVSGPAGPVKIGVGKEVEIKINVVRQFDFAGPFKLEVVLPPDLKGVTVEPIAIKAGEEEGKLIVRVEKGATIGASPVFLVRATAMFNDDTPVVHETKVTVTISK